MIRRPSDDAIESIRFWVDEAAESTVETKRAVYQAALAELQGAVVAMPVKGRRLCDNFKWVRSPCDTREAAMAWAEAECQRQYNQIFRN